MALLVKVVNRQGDSQMIVHQNRVTAGQIQLTVRHHNRYMLQQGRDPLIQLDPVEDRAYQDHTIHLLAGDNIQILYRFFQVSASVAKLDIIPPLAEFPLDRIGNTRILRHPHIDCQDRHCFHRFGNHPPRNPAWDIVIFF